MWWRWWGRVYAFRRGQRADQETGHGHMAGPGNAVGGTARGAAQSRLHSHREQTPSGQSSPCHPPPCRQPPSPPPPRWQPTPQPGSACQTSCRPSSTASCHWGRCWACSAPPCCRLRCRGRQDARVQGGGGRQVRGCRGRQAAAMPESRCRHALMTRQSRRALPPAHAQRSSPTAADALPPAHRRRPTAAGASQEAHRTCDGAQHRHISDVDCKGGQHGSCANAHGHSARHLANGLQAGTAGESREPVSKGGLSAGGAHTQAAASTRGPTAP